MTANAGSLAFFSYPSSCFCTKASPTGSIISLPVNAVSQPRKSHFCAVQESSTSAVAVETKDKEVNAMEEEKESLTSGSTPKTKSATKAPAKPLPLLMEEDVIPSLRSTLETQEDVTELQLSFNDDKLEGSFLKKGIPYTFWAFFPAGSIDGPKCFSIASYGSGVSTVEPFLVDEKRPTAKLVVFWVEKRLAAQGIIPVWDDS